MTIVIHDSRADRVDGRSRRPGVEHRDADRVQDHDSRGRRRSSSAACAARSARTGTSATGDRDRRAARCDRVRRARPRPTVSGRTTVSITRPNVQSPAPTALKTARRWTCSDSRSSGSRLEAVATGSAPGGRASTSRLDRSCARAHESPTRPTSSDSSAGSPPQLLEVQHDRLVRAQQIREDLVARPRRARRPARRLRGTATAAARIGGGSTPSRYSSAVPCRCLIVGVQAAKRDLQRLARQHQRQQREDVREALAGAVPHELVDGRRSSCTSSRRAAGGFPRPAGRPPPRAGPRRRSARCRCAMRGFFSRIAASERAALEPDLEAQVVEAEHRPSAARCETQTENTRARRRRTAKSWFGSISASISSPTRSSATLRSANTASVGDRIPGQQRDRRAGRAPRGSPSSLRSTSHDAVAVARAQRAGSPASPGSSGRRAPCASARRRSASSARAAEVGRVRRACEHQRPGRDIFDVGEIELDGAVEQAALERVDVAAIQPAGGERSAPAEHDDGERRESPSTARPARAAAPPRRTSRRRPRRPGDRSHVDDRLGRALLGRRNRRVEQLVAGAEQRAAEHRLAAARERSGCRSPGATRPADAAGEQRQRRRARRQRQAEPFEHERGSTTSGRRT